MGAMLTRFFVETPPPTPWLLDLKEARLTVDMPSLLSYSDREVLDPAGMLRMCKSSTW